MKRKYLFVGVLNTLFSVTLFYILLQLLQNVQYQVVLCACFIIANLQSHFTQRFLVWKSKNSYHLELMRFFAGAIGVFLLNVLILTFFVEILGFPTFRSQVFLTIVFTVLNYFFQKNAVFKSTNS